MKKLIFPVLVFIFSNLSAQNRIESCDYQNPIVVSYTNQVAKSKTYFGKVCEIFDYCKSKWKLTDVKTDRKGSEVLQNMTGDYDDFAVAVSSMILASGGKVAIFNSGTHLYTEVNLGDWDNKLYVYMTNFVEKRYKPKYALCGNPDSNNNYWVNLDWFAEYPAGPNYAQAKYKSAPVYPK